MLQRLYPAVIFSLLLFSAMQWAQINGLHSDLKEAKETLETRNEELKEAREELDDQNVLIEAAEAKAEAAQARDVCAVTCELQEQRKNIAKLNQSKSSSTLSSQYI